MCYAYRELVIKTIYSASLNRFTIYPNINRKNRLKWKNDLYLFSPLIKMCLFAKLIKYKQYTFMHHVSLTIFNILSQKLKVPLLPFPHLFTNTKGAVGLRLSAFLTLPPKWQDRITDVPPSPASQSSAYGDTSPILRTPLPTLSLNPFKSQASHLLETRPQA